MKTTLKIRKPITHIEVDVDENELEVVGYVKERHGHWIYTERGFPLAYGYNRCSVCGRSIGLDSTDYCPNCGAKMDEEETE